MFEVMSAPEEPPAGTESSKRVGLFGARGRVKALGVEVDRLRAEQDRLGLLAVAELERLKEALSAEMAAIQRQGLQHVG